MSQDKDPNQGEGERASARRYERRVREFIARGKVPDAAHQAQQDVEHEPDDAAKAERAARRAAEQRAPGSRLATVDEIIAKGQSLLDRVRPAVARAAKNLRTRFGRHE